MKNLVYDDSKMKDLIEKNLMEYLEPTTDKVWFGVLAKKRFKWIKYFNAFSVYWSEDAKAFIFNYSNKGRVTLDFAQHIPKFDKLFRLWECDVKEDQRIKYIRNTIELIYKKKKNAEYVDVLTEATGIESACKSAGKRLQRSLRAKHMVKYWGKRYREIKL